MSALRLVLALYSGSYETFMYEKLQITMINTNDLLNYDYFRLFELPYEYEIDSLILQHKYRELQKEFHPDNYVIANEGENTRALQISGFINQAFDTLNDPLSRAIYLLKYFGVEIDLVHDTSFPAEFLLEQIDLRERIAEAENNADFEELEEIENHLKGCAQAQVIEIGELFNNGDYAKIRDPLKKLAFYTKLCQLVDGILANL